MTRLVALSCPLCGGAVEPPVESRQVLCGYCGKRLHYQEEAFVPRLFLKPALSDADLQRQFFGALRSPHLPRDLSRRAVVLHKRRLFFPLYIVSGTRGGILDTVKERIVDDRWSSQERRMGLDVTKFPGTAAFESSRIEVETTPDTRVVLGDFHYIYSAAAAEEWDFDAAALQDLAKARLDQSHPADLSVLAKRGEILEATIPVERILNRGVAVGPCSAGAGMDLLEISVRILYVPLVEIFFRYGEQVHRVLFEELEGRAIAGRLPFRREIVIASGIPVAAAVGLALGKIGRALSFDPLWQAGSGKDSVLIWCWFGVFALFLFTAGLLFFRSLLSTPMEVEVMTGGGLKVVTPRGTPESTGGALLRFLAGFAGHLGRGAPR